MEDQLSIIADAIQADSKIWEIVHLITNNIDYDGLRKLDETSLRTYRTKRKLLLNELTLRYQSLIS